MKIKLLLVFGLISHIIHSQEKFFKKTNITPELKNSFFKKKDYERISIDSSINNYIVKLPDSLQKKERISNQNKIQFLASPLVKGKITSSYSKNRFHPVLKKWSAHKGTDFAAPYGTPIEATAGGIIAITGFTTANGNFVKIKHNETYSTQYLHMSKILVKKDQIIKKGETIGLVGSTGYATGPHVCYRFYVNGMQIDPFSVNIAEFKDRKQKSSNTTVSEQENEKDFKFFVSGFFKKSSED